MKMEKLELKHLCAYLPYGLKICYRILDLENGDPNTDNPDDRMKDCIMVMDGGRLDRCLLPETDRWYDKNSIFKPLLIPLSEVDDGLFKEIGFADEEDFKECVYNGDILYNNWLKLVSRHFDVFNLIEKNLALNKLEIK